MEIIFTPIFGEVVVFVSFIIYAFWLCLGLLPYVEKPQHEELSTFGRIYLIVYFINLFTVLVVGIICLLIDGGAIIVR